MNSNTAHYNHTRIHSAPTTLCETKRYVQRGGRDPRRSYDRHELDKAGVPIKACKKRKRQGSRSARCWEHVLWGLGGDTLGQVSELWGIEDVATYGGDGGWGCNHW